MCVSVWGLGFARTMHLWRLIPISEPPRGVFLSSTAPAATQARCGEICVYTLVQSRVSDFG